MKKTAITLSIERIEGELRTLRWTQHNWQTYSIENEYKIRFLEYELEENKKVLTTEREQMISIAENAYWDIIGSGVINTTNQEQVRKDAENLFNGTYGNGE